MTSQDGLQDARRAQHERRAALAAFADDVRNGRAEGLLPDDMRAMLEALGGRGELTAEIGVLRVMLTRVVALELIDGDPHQVALTLARLVSAIGRAVQLQRVLAGDPNDALTTILADVLEELGAGAAE